MFQRGFSGRYPLHGKEISCNLYPGSSLVKKRPKPPVPPRASGPSAGGRRHHHAGVRPAQLAGEPAAPCGVQPAQLAEEPAAPCEVRPAQLAGEPAPSSCEGAAGIVGGKTGGTTMRGCGRYSWRESRRRHAECRPLSADETPSPQSAKPLPAGPPQTSLPRRTPFPGRFPPKICAFRQKVLSLSGQTRTLL